MIDIDRLNDIKIENYIFIIYYIIITISLYANKVETEYLITDDKEIREKYANCRVIPAGEITMTFFE